MAKLQITVDTENKSVEVKVGKNKIDNVSNVWVSTEESGYFSVEVAQKEEMDGLRKTTILYASANDKDWNVQEKDPVDHKNLAECLLKREIE